MSISINNPLPQPIRLLSTTTPQQALNPLHTELLENGILRPAQERTRLDTPMPARQAVPVTLRKDRVPRSANACA
jgi:hypothetical protein